MLNVSLPGELLLVVVHQRLPDLGVLHVGLHINPVITKSMFLTEPYFYVTYLYWSSLQLGLAISSK